MNFTEKQKDIILKIKGLTGLVIMDHKLPCSLALVESSLGLKQKSPTGCKGVFNMSSIAMKDILIEMEKIDDDWNDILCGIAFIRVLLKRHKSLDEIIAKFCDPKDRHFYVDRVKGHMSETVF